MLKAPKTDKEYMDELVQVMVRFTHEQHKKYHQQMMDWYAQQNPNWYNLTLEEQMDWLDHNEVKPKTIDLIEKWIEEALNVK